ncbi:cytochrome c biogenesis heme-transporting ATPase CcmA [Vibrio sp.]|nr:cytochrome c biogenesis heme-transporting ATPase CcmA [Vibrio sp.]
MLEVKSLECKKSNQSLFHPLSFQVAPSEIVQIVGENGSGKTTLLRALVGLSDIEEGSVTWSGHSIQTEEFRGNLLYIGHLVGVKKELTAIENLRFYQQLTGNRYDDESLFNALEIVGLVGREDIPVGSLSFGQQRRVALARLWLSDQPIWVLDEPFTGIDKRGVKALEQRFIEHANAGGLIIFTAHIDVLYELFSVKKIELQDMGMF